MIKLRVNLTEKAEEGFRELLDLTKCSSEDIILDALALLHCAVKGRTQGKKISIFDPKTKEAVPLRLITLP